MGTNLNETYKWNFPTYTINSKNVLAICKFNSHFGIWFFNGVFLSDPKKVLENAQEGKTKAMRHWKFHSLEDIDRKMVTAYINESIENEKKGIRFAPKKRTTVTFKIPPKLQDTLEKDTIVKNSFKKLSVGKQKEYAAYIASAKQDKTKISRLEKILPLIKEGKGLHDKYK